MSNAEVNEQFENRERETTLRNAFAITRRMLRFRRVPLSAWVSSITGHGSTYSKQMCKEFGWDPDMPVTPSAELPHRPA